MQSNTEARFAFTLLMFVVQLLVFGLELLIHVRRIKTQPWYMPWRQYFAPLAAALISVILVSITFAGQSGAPTATVSGLLEFTDKKCEIDADVAGDGVRIAAWMQIVVLLIISLLGSFHSNVTGAKEVGAGLVLTHVSLTIALLHQNRNGTLNSLNAILGAMILDAQNVALSIQLVDKTTLAARTQVQLVVAAQSVGLAAQWTLFRRFTNDSFSEEDCNCVSIFWWEWLDSPSCRRDLSKLERGISLAYCLLRAAIFWQSTYHSLCNTQSFHLAEPRCGEEGSEEQRKGKVVENVTYPNGDAALARYGDYSSTISVIVVIYGTFALASMAAAEVAIRDLGARPSSAIDSVGQVIPLVIAASGVVRALYLFAMLFRREKDSGKLGFRWPPFRWPQIARPWFGHQYFESPFFLALQTDETPPESLRVTDDHFCLGTLLNQAGDLKQRLGVVDIPVNKKIRSILYSPTWDQVQYRDRILRPRTVLATRMEIRKLTTEVIEPDHISDLLKHPDVLRHLEGKATKTIFMVKGCKWGNGWKVTTTGGWRDPRYEAVIRGERDAADLGLNAGLIRTFRSNADVGGNVDVGGNADVNVLLAYRLHAITGRKGKVTRHGVFTRGATVD